MATPSSLYQDSFENARPNLAHTAVALHTSLSRAYTQDLASYITERIQIEDAYLKSLNKLASRLTSAGGAGDKAVFTAAEAIGLGAQKEGEQLGAWKEVRDRLQREVAELTRAHESWRKKVSDEVEGPLRQSLASRDWKEWERTEGMFGSNLREWEDTKSKADKAEAKSTKSSKSSANSKTLTLQSQLSQLTSTLSNSLPPLLSAAQKLDTSHSAFLKEALIRYGTLGADLGRERMEMGERVLVSVLGVDEGVEMQSWALRESMRAGARTRGATSNGPATGATGLSEFGIVEEEPYNATNRNGFHNDAPERARTTSRATQPHSAPPPVAPLPLPTAANVSPSKSTSSGFKLRSFLKPGSSSGNANRDRSASNASGAKNYGNLDTPAAARSFDRDSLDSRDSEQQQRPVMRTNTSVSSQTEKRKSLMPFGGSGGGLFRRQSSVTPSRGQSQQQQQQLPDEPNYYGGAGGEASSSSGPGATVDEEGYSVPPQGYDREITAVAGLPTNLMDDYDEPNAAPSSPIAKLSLPTMAPTTITESDSSRQAALERVKSTLGGPPSSRRQSTVPGVNRGRRQTTYNPNVAIPGLPRSSSPVSTSNNDDDTPLAKLAGSQASPTLSGFAPSSPGSFDGRTSSFTNLSSASATAAAAASNNPFGDDSISSSTQPQASIVETVNAQFTNGAVARLAITGEVSLRGASALSGRQLTLTHIEELEKVAPNRAFLLGEGQEGSYEVSSTLSSDAGGQGVVLRYKRKVIPGTEDEYVPLVLKARWQCLPGTTKFFVDYSAKETLEDVVLEVPFNTATTTVQAKPEASFEGNGKLVFRLGRLQKGVEGKVLAAVGTEGTAEPGVVGAKWAVEGKGVGEVGVEISGLEETIRKLVSGKYLVTPQ